MYSTPHKHLLLNIVLILVVASLATSFTILIAYSEVETINTRRTLATPTAVSSNIVAISDFVNATLVDTWVNNTVEVTLYKATFIEYKPDIEKIIRGEKEHYNFLIKNLGNLGRKIVEKRIKYLEEKISSMPDTQIAERLFVTISSTKSSTIAFANVLYDLPNGVVKDPVNVIFWHNGYPDRIDYVMKNLASISWSSAVGLPLFAHIDKDHADNADWVWKWQDKQLQRGDYWKTRHHLRVFGGGYDSDKYYSWSIGGVHYEEWSWGDFTHIIKSWEYAEYEVHRTFNGQSFTGSIVYVYLYNDGIYQGIYNNGYAPLIEVR